MTWPTSQIAESSPAALWNRMCSDALQAKRTAQFLRGQAEASQLTPAALRQAIPGLRAARVYLNANDNTPGLQDYARLVSGNATFDLSVESGALKAALQAVISEGRALHNASTGNLAADGTVTEPVQFIPAASATAFIAACAALEAVIV